jgi:hypothetical protein
MKLELLKQSLYTPKKGLPKQLIVKKSYLVLLWLSYLSEDRYTNYKLKLSSLPTTQSLITIQKAPMAHKKTSKEQMRRHVYKFKLKLSIELKALYKLEKALTVEKVFSKTSLFPGTNLIFLSSLKMS